MNSLCSQVHARRPSEIYINSGPCRRRRRTYFLCNRMPQVFCMARPRSQKYGIFSFDMPKFTLCRQVVPKATKSHTKKIARIYVDSTTLPSSISRYNCGRPLRPSDGMIHGIQRKTDIMCND